MVWEPIKICLSNLFFNGKKQKTAFWHRHVHSFHRQIFYVGFHMTVLQYYFKGRKLLGIIPGSYTVAIATAKRFSQLILWKLCKDSRCWHTSCRSCGFMTSRSNPSSSSVQSWLMPESTSLWTFSCVDMRRLCSTTPHLYNSKRFSALPRSWKTHYVYFCQLLGSLGRGGPGSNWAALREMNPQE